MLGLKDAYILSFQSEDEVAPDFNSGATLLDNSIVKNSFVIYGLYIL